ncbi:cytidylate kinase [Candidatus Magnetoovum chiemensis]|nr:cytidylate kinase [Candidatus Magnetoovum chiemensis]
MAESVSKTLNYELIGENILEQTSASYNVPAQKLKEAIESAPSLFGMSSATRKKYVSYINAAIMDILVKDNFVYYGPIAHFLIHGVSHVLKVFLISTLEDRIKVQMERENVSENEARKNIVKKDKERSIASSAVFDIDHKDSSLFDMTIKIEHIETEEIVNFILNTIKNKKFQPMTYSIKLMENLALAARAKTVLLDIDEDINVRGDDGVLYVHTRAVEKHKEKVIKEIKERTQNLAGVSAVEVEVTKDTIGQIIDER